MVNETTIQDTANLNRSMSQFNQVSLINVQIPPYNGSEDIYKYLNNYESITSMLDDEQRIKLLNKAFTPGRYESWFKRTLKPAISNGDNWTDLKRIIVDRFSISSDKDRHLKRLNEIQYNPKGNTSLIDFVEDYIYSFDKVYGLNGKEDICVQAIKVKIPEDVKGSLNLMSEYRTANTTSQLLKAVKDYDFNIAGTINRNPTDRVDSVAMYSVLKRLAEKIEQNPKEIVAAFTQNFNRESRSIDRNNYGARDSSNQRSVPSNQSRENSGDRNSNYINYRRERTPDNSDRSSERNYSDRNNYYNRDKNHYNNNQNRYNNNYHDNRNYNNSRSNNSRSNSPYRSINYNNAGNSQSNRNENASSSKDSEVPSAINIQSKLADYYAKHGKVTEPCSNCFQWHHTKHCPFNLN